KPRDRSPGLVGCDTGGLNSSSVQTIQIYTISMVGRGGNGQGGQKVCVAPLALLAPLTPSDARSRVVARTGRRAVGEVAAPAEGRQPECPVAAAHQPVARALLQHDDVARLDQEFLALAADRLVQAPPDPDLPVVREPSHDDRTLVTTAVGQRAVDLANRFDPPQVVVARQPALARPNQPGRVIDLVVAVLDVDRVAVVEDDVRLAERHRLLRPTRPPHPD